MRTIGWVVVAVMACGCGCRHHPLAGVAPDRAPRAPEPKVIAGGPGADPPDSVHGEPLRATSAPREITEGIVPKDVNVVVQEVNGQLQDAFFDYDRAALTPAAITALREDAALLAPILKQFPQVQVTVEGHCDERGSAEYNLGLGDDRARQALEMLARFGVPAPRTQVVSYGKERPQCNEMNEACWWRNRRAHLVIQVVGTN